MKNLSIFGNFLKSFVFVFLTLGVLSSEGFGADTNVALNGTATQSSNHNNNSGAENVIDNNLGNLSHTSRGEDHSWWQVDLGSIYDISKIEIFNRNDNRKYRLKNVHVMVSNTPFNPATTLVSLNTSISIATWDRKVENPTNIVTYDNINKSGRYILLQRGDIPAGIWDKLVSLREVKVWGSPAVPCNGCDCSLDTNTNTANNPSIITALNGATTDVTTCLSGLSIDNENGNGNADAADYYRFTVATAGVLKVTTSSPNRNRYHLKIWKNQGTVQYVTANEVYTDGGRGRRSHRVGDINLAVGDIISIYTKETGSGLDEYQLNFDYSITVVPGVFLDNNSVQANLPSGTEVGTLSTVPNSGSYIYNIQEIKDSSGTVIGSTGFAIAGDKLVTGELFTADAWFDVKVRSLDTISNTFQEKVFSIIVSAASLSGMNEKDFDVIYTGNAYSKMRILGNTSLCKKGSLRTTGDGNGVYGCDSNGAGISITNNNVDMINNDYDDVRGISGKDDTTINSSAALLDMPAGKKVLWAGLFWQGKLVKSNDAKKETVKNVKFKHQDETSYTGLVSQKTNWISKQFTFRPTGEVGYDYFVYQGFYDVTEQVRNNGGGYYWVGDIISVEGDDRTIAGGSYAGWSLTVVYEDGDEKMRNTTVYHGYKDVGQGNPVSTTLTGFLTPKEGVVSSELFIFASDGDTGATWSSTLESITVTDKSNTEHKLFNTLNPDGDLFNSTITKDGATVASGLPYSSANSLGIDIDSYDVGTNKYIENAQTETTIKISSENSDGFYLGTLALETELYVPELCYGYTISLGDYIKIPHKGDIKNREFMTDKRGNLELQMKVLVRNLELSDFDYVDTKLSLDFTPNAFTYKTGQSEVSPQQINGYIPATETGATGQISIGGLGTMATSGGTIGPLESVYSKLKYDFNQTSFDGHFNVNVDANFSFSPNEPSILYHFTTEGNASNTIELCPTNPVYDPVWGAFNIENALTTGGDPSSKRYPLFTQVAGRPYDVVLASYTKDANNKYTTPSRTNAKLEIELIDASNYDNNATTGFDTTCREPSSLGTGGFVDFNGVDRITINPSTIIKDYDNALALRNATFRIWTLTKKDPNDPRVRSLVTHSCTQQDDTGCFDTLYTDVYKTAEDNTTKYCETACTSSSDTTCYDCLRFYFATPFCARDNFSIRPEGFAVTIKDSNETNGSALTPIDITNNNAPTLEELAAEYKYELSVTARTYNNSGLSKQYNHHFKPDNSLVNPLPNTLKRMGTISVLEFDDVTGCADKNNTSYDIDFIDSKNINIDPNFKNANAGKYKFWMSDANWTVIDQGAYEHKTIFDNDCRTDRTDPKCSDCLIGVVTANGREVGCTISSSGASSTYNDIPLNFNPYQFGVGVTLSTLPGGDYLFMNDLTHSYYDDPIRHPVDMASVYDGNITAQGKNGGTLTNFTDGCAASDVRINATISSQVATTLPLQLYITSVAESSKVASELGREENLTLPKEAFEDSTAQGVANMQLYTTLKKPLKTIGIDNPEVSPIVVRYEDLHATDDNATSNADMKIITPTGGVSYDKDITFVYGKIVPEKEFYNDVTASSKQTKLYVSIYCETGISCANFDLNTHIDTIVTDESSEWYLADERFTASDIGVTDLRTTTYAGTAADPHVSTPLIAKGSTISGVSFGNPTVAKQEDINVSVDGIGRPSVVKIKYDPVPWLDYDSKADTASRPNNDSDYYRVKFTGARGWVGVGSTGEVTSTTSSSATRPRMNW